MEEITLKMPCVRISDLVSTGSNIPESLNWGINQFNSDIEVGFIALGLEGEGIGVANTKMPWSSQS